MNAIQTTANSALEKGPKVMGARGHAIMDYVLLGLTVAAATAMCRTNRKAAIAATIVAKTAVLNTLMTDFPGGVWRKISFQTHGQIDLGSTALVAMMPKLMGFSKRSEAKFFYGNALAMAASSALTDFNDRSKSFSRPF
jgi:hypothetical protein